MEKMVKQFERQQMELKKTKAAVPVKQETVLEKKEPTPDPWDVYKNDLRLYCSDAMIDKDAEKVMRKLKELSTNLKVNPVIKHLPSRLRAHIPQNVRALL